jgi:hypothetical protein
MSVRVIFIGKAIRGLNEYIPWNLKGPISATCERKVSPKGRDSERQSKILHQNLVIDIDITRASVSNIHIGKHAPNGRRLYSKFMPFAMFKAKSYDCQRATCLSNERRM